MPPPGLPPLCPVFGNASTCNGRIGHRDQRLPLAGTNSLGLGQEQPDTFRKNVLHVDKRIAISLKELFRILVRVVNAFQDALCLIDEAVNDIAVLCGNGNLSIIGFILILLVA